MVISGCNLFITLIMFLSDSSLNLKLEVYLKRSESQFLYFISKPESESIAVSFFERICSLPFCFRVILTRPSRTASSNCVGTVLFILNEVPITSTFTDSVSIINGLSGFFEISKKASPLSDTERISVLKCTGYSNAALCAIYTVEPSSSIFTSDAVSLFVWLISVSLFSPPEFFRYIIAIPAKIIMVAALQNSAGGSFDPLFSWRLSSGIRFSEYNLSSSLFQALSALFVLFSFSLVMIRVSIVQLHFLKILRSWSSLPLQF